MTYLREIRTYDVTSPAWGHNADIVEWNTDTRMGKAAVWLTPSPKVGDILRVKSVMGHMDLTIIQVDTVQTVKDMFWVYLQDGPIDTPQVVAGGKV